MKNVYVVPAKREEAAEGATAPAATTRTSGRKGRRGAKAMGVKSYIGAVRDVRRSGHSVLQKQLEDNIVKRKAAEKAAVDAAARSAAEAAASIRAFFSALHLFALQCYVSGEITVGLVKPSMVELERACSQLRTRLQRPPPLKLWERFNSSLPQALAHEAANFVRRGLLRRVPLEKRNYRDGYIPAEISEEEVERREAKKAAKERISRIRSWIVSTEARVNMQVLGMPATETRYIRAKNMLLQAVDSFKFTDEEIVNCGVYDWVSDFLAEVRQLNKTELRLIAARTEREFKEANAHYKVTVNNEWLVETACGSLLERIAGLQQNGDSVLAAMQVACQRTVFSLLAPSSAYTSWSVFWAIFFWIGLTFAALAVPTASVPAVFSAGIMMWFALYKLFSANFHGKRWRDVRTGA